MNTIAVIAIALSAEENSISGFALRVGIFSANKIISYNAFQPVDSRKYHSLISQLALRCTVHGRSHAKSFGEEVTACHFANSPAYESRAVISNITIIIRRLVICRSTAGATTPGIWRTLGCHGGGKDLLSNIGGGGIRMGYSHGASDQAGHECSGKELHDGRILIAEVDV